MRNFKERAKDRGLERQKANNEDDFIVQCYRAFHEFYREQVQHRTAMNLSWDNIEHLLTQAELLEGIKLGEKYNELCNRIKWVIQDVYQKDYADKRDEEKLPLNTVLEMIRKSGYQPEILTTNYDVIFEMNLGKGRYFYPGFTENCDRFQKFAERGPDQRRDDSRSAVPIVKIHGSVNWFGVGGRRNDSGDCAAFIDLENENKPKREFKSHNFDYEGIRKDVSLVLRGCDELWTSVEPLIVPPLMGKHSDSPVIQRQWREAIDALSKAVHIFVIGYSFPSTDIFMSRLWAEAFRQHSSPSEVRVVIVNRECRKCALRRLSDVFSEEFLQKQTRYVECQTSEFLTYWRGLTDYSDHFVCGDDFFDPACVGGEIDSSGVFRQVGMPH